MNYENEANINDLQLLEEIVNYDPQAELNPTVRIPDGWYLMDLSLGSNGIKIRPRSNGTSYLSVHVKGKVVAPGSKFDGYERTGFVSSIVFEKSKTSALHSLLSACGNAAPPQHSLGTLKSLVEETLAQTPQAQVRTKWEAGAKNPEGKYITVLRGMKQFPQNSDGSYNPRAKYRWDANDPNSEIDLEAQENFADFKSAATASQATT